jgi:hypothetical protein
MYMVFIHVPNAGPGDFAALEFEWEGFGAGGAVLSFHAIEFQLHLIVIQFISRSHLSMGTPQVTRSTPLGSDHIVLFGSEVINFTIVPPVIDSLVPTLLRERSVVNIVEATVCVVAGG